MTSVVEELIARAGQFASAGLWTEAEQAWRDLHQLEPANPKALFGLGFHALQRGNVDEAIRLLEAACETAPSDLLSLQALANAHRQAGDPVREIATIERALSVNAYFLPGLLAKANFLERHGKPAAAATAYASALKVAPPPSHWPEVLREQLTHARAVVDANSAEFAAFLSEQVASEAAGLSAREAERWRESASIMTGLSKPFHAECNQLHIARLPAVPFFDASDFQWASEVETRTDAIRVELLQVLEADRDRFKPYIAYGPSDPVNQWRELNHSLRWSTFELWRGGVPNLGNLARCPETARALEAVAMADIEGLCPNAMFSVLAPRTHIPPHHGETNARLVVHLPLIVPDRCTYRVGFERRSWEVGKLLIFDDTIEHEARNDSDELRVVLIFDVWNPVLSAAEREMVRAMTRAAREFAARD